MNRPLFSVIIPTYNRKHRVIRSVQSVLDQTFQNFEIIVVDDGSTDGTNEALKCFESMSNYRYRYQNNSGASSARNRGIMNAKGIYVMFLDSDDIYTRENLMNMSIAIKDSDPSTVMFAKLEFFREKNIRFTKPSKNYRGSMRLDEYILCGPGSILTPSTATPLKLAKKTLFDENVAYGDDQDFVLRLLNKGAKFKMLSHTACLVDDSHNPSRLSFTIDPLERISWLQQMKPILSDKAYLADMGWTVAKGFAQTGNRFKATKLFCKAVIRGCYSPKHAIVVCLQVFLPKSMYYKLSSFLVKSRFKP